MRAVVLWANSAVCESLISLTVRSEGHSSADGASRHRLQQTGVFLLPPCSELFHNIIDKGDMLSSLYSEPGVSLCVCVNARACSLSKYMLKAT